MCVQRARQSWLLRVSSHHGSVEVSELTVGMDADVAGIRFHLAGVFLKVIQMRRMATQKFLTFPKVLQLRARVQGPAQTPGQQKE